MATLVEICEEWLRDSEIDELHLSREMLNIPKLHAKYLIYRNAFRAKLIKDQKEYNEMRKLRSEYYSGKMDFERLNKYKWEPFDIKLRTQIAVNEYLNGDTILSDILLKIEEHKMGIDTCDGILSQINYSRTNQIKEVIGYTKYLNGG